MKEKSLSNSIEQVMLGEDSIRVKYIKKAIKRLKEEDVNSWMRFIKGEINIDQLRVEFIKNRDKIFGEKLI